MAGIGQSAVIFDYSVAVRLLHYYSGNTSFAKSALQFGQVRGSVFLLYGLYLDTVEVGVSLDYGYGFRVNGV